MVTLAQAKLNTQDDIQAGVIDEFRKSSFILARKPNGTDIVTGLTDLYAATLSLDGFHAVSLANQDLVKIWLPGF